MEEGGRGGEGVKSGGREGGGERAGGGGGRRLACLISSQACRICGCAPKHSTQLKLHSVIQSDHL